VDVGESHALQARQLGDAARHDIVLAHAVESAAVDLPFPQRVGADQEPDARGPEGIDASGKIRVVHGRLEERDPVAEAHHAYVDVLLAYGLDMVAQIAEQAP
jgi:hypothetical protein